MASKTSRIFVWIILGLVMVGLVGFGSTNFGGSARSIGTVGDTEIDVNRYFREVNATLRSFQAATGQSLPIAQAEAFGLTSQALERVISAAALDNETDRLGLSVGDDTLRAQLLQMREFQGVSGSFDSSAYEFALQQIGMTPPEFEANLRRDLARGLLQAAIVQGVRSAPVFADTLYSYARETRAFTWARLDLEALESTPPPPTEAELTAYFEAHPDDYTLPQIKQLTYVWLRPESLLETIEIDEAELRALYEERNAEFNQPERRLVERLVFPTRQEAQEAADALASGETDFASLVAARGLSLSDIDLGDVSRAELGAAADAVFGLSEPGIIGPEDSNLGPALFRMNAILAAHETPFVDVEEELRASLAGDRARRLVAAQMAELDDHLAGGATLEELAETTEGMVLEKMQWQAGTQDGIAAYDEFRAAVSAAQEGDFPELERLEDGGLFALRVERTDAPRLQELDEVREEVTSAWYQAESLALLAEQARAMLPALEGGGESLASLGLTEVAEEGLTRSAQIDGAPPEMIGAVFSLEEGEWQVLEGDDAVVLVRLDSIREADHDSAEAIAAKASFSGQVGQEIGLDIEAAFSRALQNQAGIALNQAVINAVHQQFP